jgi:hypothetical protein
MLWVVADRNLHRNNAFEWALWAILLPTVPFAWLIDRLGKMRESRK